MEDDARETAVFRAKMAERTKRYDDMIEAMSDVAKMNVELTADERRLLSDGLKHAVVARRNAGMILSAMTREEGGVNLERIQVYKRQVEEEIIKICVAAKSILQNHLIPSSNSAEDSVFYYTMVGDCYRYWAEFKIGEGKRLHASHETSLALYENATKIAEEELHPANHTRLQLALNFSVLFWDILFKYKRAYEMAQRAIQEGFSGMITLKGESEKAASMDVLELLRENVYLWTQILISEKLSVYKIDDGGEGSSSATAAKGGSDTTMLND
ncbi:hypothetical protein C2S52_006881 [Perilla frutescens var. hirtella]|nr:hypothetical protein C2S51_009098 [Perilla frutescens var. frutescens]KAH6787329.1 hypothetical protein C2S52_006881 [Perilla frutescens var. hirtella]